MRSAALSDPRRRDGPGGPRGADRDRPLSAAARALRPRSTALRISCWSTRRRCSRARTRTHRGVLRLPDRDDENEQLRLIAIDEASLQRSARPGPSGTRAFPWPRSLTASSCSASTAPARASSPSTSSSSSRRRDPAQDAAFAAGLRAQRDASSVSRSTSRRGGHPATATAAAAAARSRGPARFDLGRRGRRMARRTAADDRTTGSTVYPSLAAATASAFLGARSARTTPGRLGSARPWSRSTANRLMLMLPFDDRRRRSARRGRCSERRVVLPDPCRSSTR